MARHRPQYRSDPGRRAGGLALTSLLAVSTALALIALAMTLGGPLVPPAPAAATTQTNLALRFYAAANAVLAGRDQTAFAAILAPDFVAHAPDGASLAGSGLAAQLAAVARATPSVQFQVATVVAADEWVVAQVTPAGGTGVLAAAIGAPPATTTDLLRLAGERIVGYWPGWSLAGLPQTLPPLALAVGDTPALMALARVVYAPGADLADIVAAGPQLLLGETGQLTIRLAGSASWFIASQPERGWQSTAPSGQTLMLAPGDALLVPASVDQTQRNLGSAPAVVLVLALMPPPGGSPAARQAAPQAVAVSARSQVLAMFNPAQRGTWTSSPGGVQVNVLTVAFGPTGPGACSGAPLALTVTRFSLPPGGVIPAQPLAGAALLARDDGWLSGDPSAAAAGTPPAPPEASTRADEGLVTVDSHLGPVRNLGARPLPLVEFAVKPPATRSCQPPG